jgi:hypothetical protein
MEYHLTLLLAVDITKAFEIDEIEAEMRTTFPGILNKRVILSVSQRDMKST